MSDNKHLTLDERNIIEQQLTVNTSFKMIAEMLDKDPTTIAKEVKKHRLRKEGQSIHVSFNHCARKYNCHRKNICDLNCSKECRHCAHCNKVCTDFEDGICLRLKRAPFVCNGCSQKRSCKLTKYFYRALPSYNAYKTVLSESRQGINMTELELSNLDKIVSPLIALEFNDEGIGRTRIFYCNPIASYQKGMIEKNHEFIRYVLPKGASFDELQQKDIDLMINHINSLGRASLNWASPYDIAKLLIGIDTLKKLNLKKIPTNEIQLNQKLLKKN